MTGNPIKDIDEKTIMLVGETGSGKSTLVDCMVNYVMGVHFDDPFRFTIVQLEEEESKIHAEVLVLTSTNKNSDIIFMFYLSIAIQSD